MVFAPLRVPGLENYAGYTDPTQDHPGYSHTSPAAPDLTPAPKTGGRYSDAVERWRPLVEKYFKPEDVDKAMYVINGESGGDPGIKNSAGSGATGLFQIMPSHGINGADPETAVKWAASQVADHGWTDWGEGVTYQGKPFGVLGLTPYPGTSGTAGPSGGLLGAIGTQSALAPGAPSLSSGAHAHPVDLTSLAPGTPAATTVDAAPPVAAAPAAPNIAPIAPVIAPTAPGQQQSTTSGPSDVLGTQIGAAPAPAMPTTPAPVDADPQSWPDPFGVGPVYDGPTGKRPPQNARELAIVQGGQQALGGLGTAAAQTASGLASFADLPSAAVRAIPGEQSLPAPVRAVAENAPYALIPAGDLSLAARAAMTSAGAIGGFGLQKAAQSAGAGPLIQTAAGLGGNLIAGGLGVAAVDRAPGAAESIARNAVEAGPNMVPEGAASRIVAPPAEFTDTTAPALAAAAPNVSAANPVSVDDLMGWGQESAGAQAGMRQVEAPGASAGGALEQMSNADLAQAWRSTGARLNNLESAPAAQADPSVVSTLNQRWEMLDGEITRRVNAGSMPDPVAAAIERSKAAAGWASSPAAAPDPSSSVFPPRSASPLPNITQAVSPTEGVKLAAVGGGAETPEEQAARQATAPLSGDVLPPAGGGGHSVAEQASQKLVTQIQMSQPIPELNAEARAALRSQRYAAASSVAEGDGNASDRLGQMRNTLFQRGEMPRSSWSPPQVAFTPGETSALHQTILDSGLNRWQQAGAYDALKKVLEGNYTGLQRGEIDLLDRTFGPELGQAVNAQIKAIPEHLRLSDSLYNAARSGLANVRDALSIGTTTATYGHAPILRQGLGFAITHPSVALESLQNFYRVLRDPQNLEALTKGIQDNPWVTGVEDVTGRNPANEQAIHGIRASDFITRSDRPDPTFVSNLMSKVGLSGNRSQQSAYLYLDSLRKLGYADEAQRLWETGERDPKEYKALWDTVSNATGHGVSGQASVYGVNPVFSPQAMLGRFRSLLDPIVQPGSLNPLAPGARSVAIRNLLGVGAFTAGIEGIAALAGQKVTFTSSTPLGRVHLGLSNLDPSAGYGSIIHLAVNLAQAAYAGDLGAVRDGVASYLRGQLGPVNDMVVSTLTGKDWRGQHYNLMQQVQSGALAESYAPIAAQSIMDSVNANGPVGALYAAPSLAALSVSTSTTLTSQRDKIAGQMFGGKSYSQLNPLQQNIVNKDPAVTSAAPPPSPAKQLGDTVSAQAQAEEQGYLDHFKAGTLDETMPSKWTTLGTEARKAAQVIQDQYGSYFASLPVAQKNKVTDGYYSDLNTVNDPTTGAIDFDATNAKRQEYLNGLSTAPGPNGTPSDREIMDSTLALTEQNKTPEHQQYLSYIDAKKAAGFFSVDQADPKYAQKIDTLYAANPALDAQNWYWKGGVQGATPPPLHSTAAVDQALAMLNDQATPIAANNRDVKFSGLTRPINENAQTTAAWQASKAVINAYDNQVVPANQDAYAQKMFQKPFAQLSVVAQQSVTEKIRSDVRLGTPALDAYLVWWGESDVIDSQAALTAFQGILKQYGNTPPKANWQPRLAANAR